MKKLLETVSSILFFVSILALFFVLEGTPNLWDKWHDRAMKNAECKQ